MKNTLRLSALAALVSLLLAPLAGALQVSQAEPSSPTDAPLEDFRGDLLDLAADASRTISVDPHVKTRARAMENVAIACLELEQPSRALRLIQDSPNWRIGVGYGDLARYCAEHGEEELAQEYLGLAVGVAEWPADKFGQSWRKDRVLVSISRARLALGEEAAARAAEAGVENEAETGKVDAERAKVASDEGYEELLAASRRAFESQNFDLSRNALAVCIQLFESHYRDEERRAEIEALVKESWSKLPVTIRIDVLLELVRVALEAGDVVKASEVIEEARGVLDATGLNAEYRVPLLARIAAFRYRAGDAREARREAGAALALYNEGRTEIVNVSRAACLRPLAEAYQKMGASEEAASVYRLAIHEGFENTNVRPRAEDLLATCCSMARTGFQPDPSLWEFMRHIQADNFERKDERIYR
ncbi:MAG: hypothetical protein AAF682_27015 [Planctomycetota bacterium]